MSDAWHSEPLLAPLAAIYEEATSSPASISDEALVTAIQKTLWPSNCWAVAEAAFALIAPACWLRPHLTPILLRLPVEAMVAGGLSSPQGILSFGIACATRSDPYVQPTEEGRLWLTTILPHLGPLAAEVFADAERRALED